MCQLLIFLTSVKFELDSKLKDHSHFSAARDTLTFDLSESISRQVYGAFLSVALQHIVCLGHNRKNPAVHE